MPNQNKEISFSSIIFVFSDIGVRVHLSGLPSMLPTSFYHFHFIHFDDCLSSCCTHFPNSAYSPFSRPPFFLFSVIRILFLSLPFSDYFLSDNSLGYFLNLFYFLSFLRLSLGMRLISFHVFYLLLLYFILIIIMM